MTLNEIISTFREAGIEDPLRDALLLTSAVEGVSEASLICDRDRQIDVRAADKCGPMDEKNGENGSVRVINGSGGTILSLDEAVRRRASREPLQYILGTWEFMGLPFRVTPKCLIPRADTEILTELAISSLPRGGRLLDLCTGSGCIAIASAHYRPDISVTAVEKYPAALECARFNASLNGVGDKIVFVLDDVTSPKHTEGRFDVIVSNPPYVTAEEMKTLEPELSYEPREALTDEGNGLSIISAVIENYVLSLADGGILAVEHGSTQGADVRKIMEKYGSAETLLDLGGKERATVLHRPCRDFVS